MRIVLMLTLAAALGGCASRSDTMPVPPEVRRVIADYAKTKYYFDPYSLRDIGISGTTAPGTTQSICVRANAKNRMGGYIGIKQHRFLVVNGQVASAEQDDLSIYCRGAQYVSFPELEPDDPRGARR